MKSTYQLFLKRCGKGALAIFCGIIISFILPAIYEFPLTLVTLETHAQSPININIHTGYPTRVAIPALALYKNIESVGINEKGNVDVPQHDVGWYGKVPGEIGSAVLVGHSKVKPGVGGVFYTLNKIHTGDEIDVTDNNNNTQKFIVKEIGSYDYRSKNTDKIFQPHDNVPHLTLITCSGNWVKSAQTYDKRLVVFAEPEA